MMRNKLLLLLLSSLALISCSDDSNNSFYKIKANCLNNNINDFRVQVCFGFYETGKFVFSNNYSVLLYVNDKNNNSLETNHYLIYEDKSITDIYGITKNDDCFEYSFSIDYTVPSDIFSSETGWISFFFLLGEGEKLTSSGAISSYQYIKNNDCIELK